MLWGEAEIRAAFVGLRNCTSPRHVSVRTFEEMALKYLRELHAPAERFTVATYTRVGGNYPEVRDYTFGDKEEYTLEEQAFVKEVLCEMALGGAWWTTDGAMNGTIFSLQRIEQSLLVRFRREVVPVWTSHWQDLFSLVM